MLARASHGEVALEVPDGSAFGLEAESQHGQVDAPLAGLRSEREERRRGQRVLGQQGSGGPQVKLLADGDVRLESRPPRAVSDGGVQKPRVAATTTPEASVERPRATASPKSSPAPTPSTTPGPRPRRSRTIPERVKPLERNAIGAAENFFSARSRECFSLLPRASRFL